jgi:hypothetical protein
VRYPDDTDLDGCIVAVGDTQWAGVERFEPNPETTFQTAAAVAQRL